MRDGPRLSKCPMAGPSKKDAEQALRSGRFSIVADEESSDSGNFSEKKHQEKRRRAAAWLWREVKNAERMRPRSRGFTRKGQVRGDHKLHEPKQEKERKPSTPTPPNGSRKESPPDSALFPPESPPLSSLRGEDPKTTKTRRQSSGPRKTHGQFFHTAGASLPLADPPSLPNVTKLPFLHQPLSRESPRLIK